MANRDTVKTWFETGDKPTQEQFWQLFEWLFFKDEGITMENINGLVDSLQGKLGTAVFNAFEQGERIAFNGDGSYQVPQFFLLEKLVVFPGANATMRIGTAAGLDDLLPDIDVSSAIGNVIAMDVYASVNKTIYISGLPGGSAVVFLKRKIKQ